jgi:hypothetical protein
MAKDKGKVPHISLYLAAILVSLFASLILTVVFLTTGGRFQVLYWLAILFGLTFIASMAVARVAVNRSRARPHDTKGD